jgi:exopolyphosphatase / guanosine-5'-triphosphate,3'-diphosphate pyrophosphatase
VTTWSAAVIEAQLGRPARGLVGVAVTCPFGFPAVVETSPYLEDGEPFPTLLYLTCPSAVQVVSREEAAGGVASLRRLVRDSPAWLVALVELETRYRRRRSQLAKPMQIDGGAVLETGIGGPPLDEASCLHAYTAALLAATAGWFGSEATPTAATPSAATTRHWHDLLAGLGRLWCIDRVCASVAPSGGRRAAIDLGTNSVRLLVADLVAGRPRTVVRRARVTRLGEGLETAHRFSPEARQRTAAVVAEFVTEARQTGAETISLVGTSACREAADGAEFVGDLGREHAIAARVVSGEEEARLSFLGATLDITGNVVLLDVGGGSTELVRTGVEGGLAAVSVEAGCVRGTERWFTSDPPSPKERAAARAAIKAQFAPLRDAFGASAPEGRPGAAVLVGVAGTVTTFACLSLGLAAYDPDAIHLTTLDRTRLADEVERLATMRASDRAALSCMQAGRADVIVAGGEILLGAMETLGWERLIVSERDILDGIVMAGDGSSRGPGGADGIADGPEAARC